MTAVSILMSAYNREDRVGAAIESVITQTYRHWELVVVDSGSTDRTWDVIQAFDDPRIAAVRMPASTPVGRVHNQALERSTGPVVMTLDSGDQYLPEKLERQVAFLDAHPDVDVVGTYVTSNPHSPELEARFNRPTDLNDPAEWIGSNRLAQSSVAVRRARYVDMGGLREDLQLIPHWEFWLRLISRGSRISVMPEELTMVQVGSVGSSRSDPTGAVREYLTVSTDYWQRFLRESPAPEAATKNLVLALERFALLPDGDRDRVSEPLGDLIRASPEGMAAVLEVIGRQGGIVTAQAETIEEQDGVITSQAAAIETRDLHLEKAARELDIRAEQIDRLSLQSRQSQDRVTQLLPLEVSPKVQLRALRRTLPQAARRRLGRVRAALAARRQPAGEHVAPDPSVAAALATTVSLRHILNDLGVGANNVDVADLRLPADSSSPQSERLGGAENPVVPPSVLHRPGASPSSGHARDLIEASGAHLLTFDIWDTLIERNRPADAAKTATARRMVLMRGQIPDSVSQTPFTVMALRAAVEAELAATHPGEEYLVEDVLNRTLEELGVPAGRFCRELAAELTELEVEDEIRWSRPRGWVCDLAADPAPTTVLVSDFYMSGRHLTRIVNEVTGQDHDVVVSVDRGVSKRVGGRLLESVRADHDVEPQHHLHVGDNPHSDVAEQVRTGGIAIHVPRDERFAAPGLFAADSLDDCWSALQQDLAQLSDSTSDPARVAGQRLAPLAALLTARGIEEAYRVGTDRVHYASREGLFLARVHERVQETLRVPRNDAIRAVHLEMSRRSTFGASLEEPFHISLHRMWSMYSEQSVAAMLVSIGVSPEECVEDLAAVGLTADTHLSDASRDPRVTALLDRPSFTSLLHERVMESRRLLKDYLIGRTTVSEPFLMVDVGWRGTIQDNLTRALGLRSVTGFYLGLFPFLNAQPFGSRKVGIAFDGNAGDDFSFAEPPAAIERPWTPHVPSTVGYRRDGDTVVPILEREQGVVSQSIESFQEGTLEAADLVAQWLVGMGLTVDLLKPQLAAMTRDLWTAPPAGLADIWFESAHDDSFGALNSVSFAKERPGPEWLEGPVSDHLRQGMLSSGWAAGYLSWEPVRGVVDIAAQWRDSNRG